MTDYEQASPRDRTEADRRLAMLNRWSTFLEQAGATNGHRAAATREFVATERARGERASQTALYAWAAAYRVRRLDGLLPRWCSRGRETTLIEADRKLFLALWSGEADRKILPTYRGYLMVRRREALPGPPPSLDAIRYMVSKLSEEERAALRLGPTGYRRVVIPYITRDYESILPLEWYCIDHRQLDLICLDRQGRRCRPWVTAIEDLRTRRVGFVLSTQPNQDVVLYCLAGAILAWGIPTNFYVDNGKDFRAKSVTGGRRRPFRLDLNEDRCRSLCDQLGIEVHFAQPFNAEAKPVERFFLTLSESLDKLFDTYCGRSTAHKPEDLAETLQTATIPTLDEVGRVVLGWIESDYHARPHSGQGMHGRSPNEVWAALADQVVKRTATREMLKYFFLRSEPALVRNNRVRLFGRDYEPAAENLDCLYGQLGKEIVARYDPQDAAQIFVTDREDRPLGWLVQKKLIGWGKVATEQIAAAKKLQARHRSLQRAARKDLAEWRQEPDALRRIIRDELAAQAPTGTDGRPTPPTPPPGKPKVVEIMPMSAGARASARMVARPPAEDARLHAVRAELEEEAVESLEPRATSRERKPSRGDLSDEAIELLGRGRRMAVGTGD